MYENLHLGYFATVIDLCNNKKKKIEQLYVTSFHLLQLLDLIENTCKTNNHRLFGVWERWFVTMYQPVVSGDVRW